MNNLIEFHKSEYRKFVSSLEMDDDLKQSLWDDNFIEKNPEFYLYYPKLFSPFFKLDKKDIELDSVCTAGFMYYRSVILLDALIDEKQISFIPQIIILQEEAIKLLTSVFGINSYFWKDWNDRKSEYFQAVTMDKQLLNKKDISLDTYSVLADYKSSFGKVAISAVYELSGQKDAATYQRLYRSHQLFSVAFQIFDDIRDFRKDYKKQFNWAVYTTLQKRTDTSADTLNKYLYIDGVAQNLMQVAVDLLNQAVSEISNLRCTSENLWLKLLKETKDEIEASLDTTMGYVEELKTKISFSRHVKISDNSFDISANNIQDDLILNGLKFINDAVNKNFSELKHVMYLSDASGFSNDTKIHIGDVFQRGLVADCMLDIQQKYKVNLSHYIENEVSHFLSSRQKEDIQVWSYFQTVKEIAADADDLGQIMQFFIRIDKIDLIRRDIDKAIEILFKDRCHSDGGIETWIIPKTLQTSTQKVQENYNENKWGKGPDNEVIANFLFAVSLYNYKKYESDILKSTDYLLKRQHAEGYWESRWYYGKYYGTYVCLRLLCQLKSDRFNISVNRALIFISSSQNHDGGWGLSEISDPLNTSFAILALKYFPESFTKQIESGLKYLSQIQNEDGSWDAVDFIIPKAYHPYKSKTLTTAFVLKAFSVQ